jgi:hypothetical protein
MKPRCHPWQYTCSGISNYLVQALNAGQAAEPEKRTCELQQAPDGTRIAFTSNRDGDFDVWVMNADGTNPINLTRNTPERRALSRRQPATPPPTSCDIPALAQASDRLKTGRPAACRRLGSPVPIRSRGPGPARNSQKLVKIHVQPFDLRVRRRDT